MHNHSSDLFKHLNCLESMEDQSNQQGLVEFFANNKENFVSQMSDFDNEQKIFDDLNRALENDTLAIQKQLAEVKAETERVRRMC